jgi:hypothetical protein
VFNSIGVQVVMTAPQIPTINGYAQRFIRTVRAERTDRMLIAGEAHARRALAEYIAHYNTARSHQGHHLNLRAPDDPTNMNQSPSHVIGSTAAPCKAG